MPTLQTPGATLLILQVLLAIFLAILFLQSGLDKVLDRKGNLEWLTGHFAKSPLARWVPSLVTALTMLELTAGILSAIGALFVIYPGNTVFAFWGAVISGIALVALFFGQRMAKDYAGAASLVPYFLLSLVAIYLLSFPRA
jgi:uncharacterized membrane protein YphA (DoxX/SURF4 family)